jgi:2-methylcitrate dehydratase PrpD
MTLTHELAEYIADTTYDDIPGEGIVKAKECILDSIGCALYGSAFAASGIALDVACDGLSPAEGAAVLGTGRKVPARIAAFVNGVMTHVADFDDTVVSLNGHPSCVMMPASLAMTEASGQGGKTFVTAYVVGCEIAGKLGLAMGPAHHRLGWHPTATLGTIGAAAASAKALNLDRDKAANALGIAASSASGLRANFGSMTKSFHAGNAARNGVFATRLAEKGFTSSEAALEGEAGFARAFGAHGDLSKVPGSLGVDPVLRHVMLKPYPCCAGIHPAVDALRRILGRSEGMDIHRIERIEALGRPVLKSVLLHPDPQTPLEAKFSMEYCVASTLIHGAPGISRFEEGSLFDPEVRALMKRVELLADRNMEEIFAEQGVLSPTRINIHLPGGEVRTDTVLEARGGPSNPMSRREIQDKFRECSSGVLPESQADRVLTMIDALEEVDSMGELTSALASLSHHP